MKERLIGYIEKLMSEAASREEIERLLEEPKNESFGDYSIPMFAIARKLKRNPAEAASELKKKADVERPDFIEDVKNEGPYLNFYFNKGTLAQTAVEKILSGEYNKTAVNENSQRTIIVEYAQPNTNKPLHLGHLRNMILGKSIILLLKRRGYDVKPVVLFNDRGIAICKSMLMYKMFGNSETPESEGMKSDQFVGKYYVMYEKKRHEEDSLESKAREMLRKWEEGDKETVDLWKQMNGWAEEGIKETFRELNLPFEREYYESQVYERGAEIVSEGLEKGIFEKTEDGAVVYRIDEDNIYTLLREDGTALYITQDIALAERKRKDYGEGQYVFVVANDQSYHFKILFEILQKLGISNESDNYHFAYGLVTLPEGKMSSRKGNVIGADALIEDITESASGIVKEKNEGISKGESEKRGRKIGLAALSYMMLKQNPLSDIVFDEEKSLSFEGETGPYILYAYARIKSVLRKAKENLGKGNAAMILGEEEYLVAKKLLDYADVINESADNYRPSHLANYLLDMAQLFNEYYHKHQVIGSENEQSRLKFCQAVSIVLKDGLSLLGIDTLEEM